MTQTASLRPLPAKWREGLPIIVAILAFALLYFLLAEQLPYFVIAVGIVLLALRLNRWLLLPAIAIATVLIAVAAGFFAVDQVAVGNWIAANTPANATVATAQVGALTYYAQRTIVAPQFTEHSFFIQLAPDLVVLSSDQTVAWENFSTTYQQVFSSGNLNVYQRVVNFSWLPNAQSVDFLYNQFLPNRSDLRLVGLAVFSSVHPGELIRIALSWKLSYPAVQPVTVRIALMDHIGTAIASLSDQYPLDADPVLWTQPQFTTYHLLPLPIDAATGNYNLRIGINVGEGDLGEHIVQTVSIVS